MSHLLSKKLVERLDCVTRSGVIALHGVNRYSKDRLRRMDAEEKVRSVGEVSFNVPYPGQYLTPWDCNYTPYD